MLKRRANAPKTARKRKKGNATYATTSLDPTDDDKMVVEDVRVWDISASEKTGRVTGSRRTLKHYHQASASLPEEPSMSGGPGGAEEIANTEESGIFADTESSKVAGKQRPKRKRVRVKENDSVSESLTSPPL
jgi:hypothetical protein